MQSSYKILLWDFIWTMKLDCLLSLNSILKRLEKDGFVVTKVEEPKFGAEQWFTEVETAEELTNLVNAICEVTGLSFVFDGAGIVIVNDWI